MTREEKEFLEKLKNRCDSLGIDINIVGNPITMAPNIL